MPVPIGAYAPPDQSAAIDEHINQQAATNDFQQQASQMVAQHQEAQTQAAVSSFANDAQQVAQIHQQDQSAIQGFMDEASKVAAPYMPKLTSPNPSTAAPQNDQQGTQAIGTATSAALKAGAPPDVLQRAAQELGNQDYINLCEAWVEHVSGSPRYGSAIEDYNANAGNVRSDWQNAKPGDRVFWGSHPENGGYGHVGLYTGNGQTISSAAAGVVNAPVNGYFRAQPLGYLPAGGTMADTQQSMDGNIQPATQPDQPAAAAMAQPESQVAGVTIPGPDQATPVETTPPPSDTQSMPQPDPNAQQTNPQPTQDMLAQGAPTGQPADQQPTMDAMGNPTSLAPDKTAQIGQLFHQLGDLLGGAKDSAGSAIGDAASNLGSGAYSAFVDPNNPKSLASVKADQDAKYNQLTDAQKTKLAFDSANDMLGDAQVGPALEAGLSSAVKLAGLGKDALTPAAPIVERGLGSVFSKGVDESLPSGAMAMSGGPIKGVGQWAMDHPIVKQAAETFGLNELQTAEAVRKANNPTWVSNMMKEGGTPPYPLEVAALSLAKAAKSGALMDAIATGKGVAPAAVEAATLANPEPKLAQAIQTVTEGRSAQAVAELMKAGLSKEAATTQVERGGAAVIDQILGPAAQAPVSEATQKAIKTVSGAPADLSNAATREGAREALGIHYENGVLIDPDAAPPGPMHGPPAPSPEIPAQAPLEGYDQFGQPLNAPRVSPLGEAKAPPEIPVAQGPPVPPEPPSTPPTLGQYDAMGNPMNSPMVKAPGFGWGSLLTGRAIGGAAGALSGEWVGYQAQDQRDPELVKLLHALPYAGAGLGVGATIGVGADKGLATAIAQAKQTYYGNLLGPPSVERKSIFDIQNLLTSGAVRGANALTEKRWGDIAPETAAFYKQEMQAFPEAWQKLVEALKPSNTMGSRSMGNPSDVVVPASVGQYASTLGSRVLDAITQFTTTMLEQGHAASDYVGKMGRSPLPSDIQVTPEISSRVRSTLALGPSEGWIGAAMQNLLGTFKDVPVLGGVAAPFRTVGANLADKTISAMPGLGALNLAGRKGVSPANVLLRQTMGLGATAAIVHTYGNNITGAGPADPTANKAWRDQGNKPWSVKLPWNDTWIQMKHLPPIVQGPLRAAALYVDQAGQGKQPELGQFLYDMGSMAGDLQFVPTVLASGIDVMNGVRTGQYANAAGNLAGDVATTPIPWYMRQASAAERTTAPDYTGKQTLGLVPSQTDKIGAAVGARVRTQLPGTPSQTVPAANDMYGRDIPNQNQGAGQILNPFSPSTPRPDAFTQQLGDAGKVLAAPPTSLPTGQSQYGKPIVVPLTGIEQAKYQEIRGARVRQIMADPKAQAALNVPNKAIREQVAQEIIRQADEYTKAQMYGLLKLTNAQAQTRIGIGQKAGAA